MKVIVVMLREDEEIEQAERELREFVFYIGYIPRLEQDLKELDMRLNTYGVSSPKILSVEEAKYQKGTKIYSDVNLLQIFAEQDEVEQRLRFYRMVISRVCRRLVALEPTEYQTDLLYYRFERRMTYEDIARRVGYSRQAIQWQMEWILRRFSTCQ